MSLALVYIARGIDGGLSSVKAFFDAYCAHPSGCPHELIVIVKGWSCMKEQDELRQLAQIHVARLIDMPDDGFDWGAYMRVIPLLSHDWVCLLNTHSRPRVNGWLNILRTAAETPNNMSIGAVGATGSWEKLFPILPLPLLKTKSNAALLYPFQLANHTIRFATNIRNFPSFPNSHLRSNAIIVRRKLFIDFIATQKIPCCKHDAHILESGKTGFSAFMISRGLKLLVAGANNRGYEQEQWINSGTFRVPNQPNLLVADNQTIAYAMANRHMKRRLETIAWGQTFS